MSVFVHLAIKEETKDLLLGECVRLYREAHPDLDDIKISQDHILRRVCEYYIK